MPAIDAASGRDHGYSINIAPGAFNPREAFFFRPRRERVDWYEISTLDIDRIVRQVDVPTLQSLLENITYCDVEAGEDYRKAKADSAFVKLFRIAQLTIEYLLHSQEYFMYQIQTKDAKIKELSAAVDKGNVSNTETREEFKRIRKECHKYKKTVATQKMMLNAGANAYYKCTDCSKAFVTAAFLHDHIARRHPESASNIITNNTSREREIITSRETEVLKEVGKLQTLVASLSQRLEENERSMLEKKIPSPSKLPEASLRNDEVFVSSEVPIKEPLQKELEVLRATLIELKETGLSNKTETNPNNMPMEASRLGVLIDDDSEEQKRRLKELEQQHASETMALRQNFNAEMEALKAEQRQYRLISERNHEQHLMELELSLRRDMIRSANGGQSHQDSPKEGKPLPDNTKSAVQLSSHKSLKPSATSIDTPIIEENKVKKEETSEAHPMDLFDFSVPEAKFQPFSRAPFILAHYCYSEAQLADSRDNVLADVRDRAASYGVPSNTVGLKSDAYQKFTLKLNKDRKKIEKQNIDFVVMRDSLQREIRDASRKYFRFDGSRDLPSVTYLPSGSGRRNPMPSPPSRHRTWRGSGISDSRPVPERGTKIDGTDSLISKSRSTNGQQATGKDVLYTIHVTTGKRRGADMDAKAFCCIHGSEGSTNVMALSKKNATKKSRKLTSLFGKGMKASFNIDAPDVGELESISLWHDSSGTYSNSWFIEKIVVEGPYEGARYNFDVSAWFDKTSGDHKTSREIFPTSNNKDKIFISNKVPYSDESDMDLSSSNTIPDLKEDEKFSYTLHVSTSENSLLNMKARVFINIHGTTGDSGILRLHSKSATAFTPGKTDIFNLTSKDVGKVTSLAVWHNNKPVSSWNIKRIALVSHDGDVYSFPCDTWLDKKRGDQKVHREFFIDSKSEKASSLSLSSIDSKVTCTEDVYLVTTTTGSKIGAGTDSNVWVILYGQNGVVSDTLRLHGRGNCFERGKTDKFRISSGVARNLGNIEAIRIGHDCKGLASDWYLESASVKHILSSKQWKFPVASWICKKKSEIMINAVSDDYDPSDGTLSVATKKQALENAQREAQKPMLPYSVTVHTGDVRDAGTTANVTIQVFGKMDNSDQLRLQHDRPSQPFQRKGLDIFYLHFCDVGAVRRIQLAHDGTGSSADWYVSKVVLSTRLDTYTFWCEDWLSSSRGDGRTSRDLFPNTKRNMAISNEERALEEEDQSAFYTVQVSVGHRPGAGTDSKVFIQIFGTEGSTKPLALKASGDPDGTVPQSPFVKGQKAIFDIDGFDVGEVERVVLWHDSTGISPSLYVDSVIVEGPYEGAYYEFVVEQWFDRSSGDRSTRRELYPSSSGRDQLVWPMFVPKSPDHESASLRDILNDSLSTPPQSPQKYCEPMYPNNRVSAPHRPPCHDVEDTSATYVVHVITGNHRNAGTCAAVFIDLHGDRGDTGHLKLRRKTLLNSFDRNSTETFTLKAFDVGIIRSLDIWHSDKSVEAAWQLDHVIIDMNSRINNENTPKRFIFTCCQWLDGQRGDKMTHRVLRPSDGSVEIKSSVMWRITTETSDIQNSGTDATVSVKLIGSDGMETEFIPLISTGENFKRGQKDVFIIESPDIGELDRIVIYHNSKGSDQSWHLAKISLERTEIAFMKVFYCNQWFNQKQSQLLLLPQVYEDDDVIAADNEKKNYEIQVVTGDVRNAGTTANVFIDIQGKKDHSTGALQLQKNKNDVLFKRGHTDVFNIQAVDVGEISSIQVWHDSHGISSSWYLEHIEVKVDGISYIFHAKRFFDKKNGTRHILFSESPTENTESSCESSYSDRNESYRVDITTGSMRGAGTDANVFIIIIGENSKTDPQQLKSKHSKTVFDRASTDTFDIRGRDIGSITSIELWHDNSGIYASWYVEKIVVKGPDGSDISFQASRWLDKKNGLRCLLLPDEKDNKDDVMTHLNIENELMEHEGGSAYNIIVTTGSVNNAGTQSNVFIFIRGENGDIGPHQLHTKDHRNFEKGKVDKFVLDSDIDIGDIESIEIWHDNKGFGAAWYLEEIAIIVPNKKEFVFKANRWLNKENGLRHELFPNDTIHTLIEENKIEYFISVVTGDVNGAGTDANVFIVLHGARGDIGPHSLESDHAAFEKNSIDEFNITDYSIGSIRSIEVWQDNSGSSWYLDRITVQSSEQEEVCFTAGCWFNKRNGLRHELFPKDKDPPNVLFLSDEELTVSRSLTPTPLPSYGDTAHVSISSLSDTADSYFNNQNTKPGCEDSPSLILDDSGEMLRVSTPLPDDSDLVDSLMREFASPPTKKSTEKYTTSGVVAFSESDVDDSDFYEP